MPSTTARASAAPARASRSKQHLPPKDVIEISTDESVAHQDEALDDMEMSDFEDVDPAAPATTGASSAASEDLDMEDVDLDADQSAQDLHDMYAAAYREVQAKYDNSTGTGEDEYKGSDDEEGRNQDDDASAGSKPIPIFKDGKGQHRGVEISVGSHSTKQTNSSKQKSNNFLTPRDRQNRITAHKLLVLSMLAHARVRNKWCNDAELRDTLAHSVPEFLITKLRSIHPKKVTEQRERIRMFESFLSELVRWWSSRFRLDPTMVASSALRQPDQDIATGVLPGSGRRIDGWIVETASEREQRHRREQREQQRYKQECERQATSVEASNGNSKGKAKAKARDNANNDSTSTGSATLQPPTKAMEITIFAPGPVIRPIFLRLLPAAEHIVSPAGLRERAEQRSGSRETSAQLFCALCRSIGIPARLVVSPQPLSWSVGASKLANTTQPGSLADKKPNQLRVRAKKSASHRFASKPINELTSDDDDDDDHSVSAASSSAHTKGMSNVISVGSRSSADEATASDSSTGKQITSSTKGSAGLTKKAVLGAAAKTSSHHNNVSRGHRSQPISVDDTASDISSGRSVNGARKAGASRKTSGTSSTKNKGKARQVDVVDADPAGLQDEEHDDYRPEKWKHLKTPLQVEHKVKLRPLRPKQLKNSEVASEDTWADPVDLQAPPTMWVEVFSKPYQKWITVDPIRCMIRPCGNRHMEPAAFDRQNKLLYVVAFEEDGYARDVTARYTKTLNSRVSRLRPPTRCKGEEDWWTRVVRGIHRPQRLDRDAMEDAELQDNSSREPMPSSINAFKDHPIYFIEKFLKRDEVVFPRRQIATFQGMAVFRKADVQTLRSSRQWYNEGRVVKEGEVALKFVKSRGYTLANKRAEEQARIEGRDVAQEGLYAEFQTELYVAPAVGADGVIPTNGFGNIDLFVPSMLPAGAVHLPYSGIAKVAKKLGVAYAEAITGFEFRKQRGMPKISGIVVAHRNAELVEQAYWQQQHQDALKLQAKKLERAMKNWRMLINALRIATRLREQYAHKIKRSKTAPDTRPKERDAHEDGDAHEDANTAVFGDTLGPALEHEEHVHTNDHVECEPSESSATSGASVSGPRQIISLAQLASADADADADADVARDRGGLKRSATADHACAPVKRRRAPASLPRSARTSSTSESDPHTSENRRESHPQPTQTNTRKSRRLTLKLARNK